MVLNQTDQAPDRRRRPVGGPGGPHRRRRAELSDLLGQRSAVRLLLNEHRDEYSLSGLERRRLLPIFMLQDDTITLDTSMWSRDE